MFFRDLDVCNYHSGPFDGNNWAVPLLAIGWLEYPQTFTTGVVSLSFITTLRTIVDQSRLSYSHYNFRGGEHCSFCVHHGLNSPGPIWSQENIFVPGKGVVYLAPGGITHYVEAHSYLPPTEFVEAVMTCPDVELKEYGRALRISNAGIHPPLKGREEFDRWLRQLLKR